MTNELITARRWRADPTAGRIAIVSGIIAAVGVVFLILLYVLDFTPVKNVSIVSARARSRYSLVLPH